MEVPLLNDHLEETEPGPAWDDSDDGSSQSGQYPLVSAGSRKPASERQKFYYCIPDCTPFYLSARRGVTGEELVLMNRMLGTGPSTDSRWSDFQDEFRKSMVEKQDSALRSYLREPIYKVLKDDAVGWLKENTQKGARWSDFEGTVVDEETMNKMLKSRSGIGSQISNELSNGFNSIGQWMSSRLSSRKNGGEMKL
ncbi:uncharacterized protein L203_104063 [Cryptococcus depauperatus CBS 7841]|uniref:Uncharacterized protein n=1 Tax=Cryptococcus depauperatus CBS 7841 TaxID=1295531 RepID=A0AAJ8JV33_9TREE